MATIEEVEAFMKEQFARGELDTGLYNCGLQHVVVDVVSTPEGDVVTFSWFDHCKTLEMDTAE